MTTIKNHDVQSININSSVQKAFAFIVNPENLPQWTGAFKQADEKSALLITPKGELPIGLEIRKNEEAGTVDWYMTMPDQSVGVAYSRVNEGPDGNTIYSFVLLAPPVPLEEVEGTLAAQIGQLKDELLKLKSILES